MYIQYASSDEYACHTAISIKSLLENNKDIDVIYIFLIDLGITEINRKKIENMVLSYGRIIEFMYLKESVIHKHLGDRLPLHYGSLATYARLCPLQTLPEYVERILYIDSDTIISGSIKALDSLDMGKCVIAGVPSELGIERLSIVEEEYESALKHKYYINCGVLLIDIRNWKKYDFDSMVKIGLQELKEFKYKDQTILNHILEDSFLFKLPCKYNYQLHDMPRYLIKIWSKQFRQYSREEIIEADKEPAIIHYPGDMVRPWDKQNISSMANYYLKYKEMSPYREVPLVSIFNEKKYDSLKITKRVAMTLILAFYQRPIGFPLYCIHKLRINLVIKKESKK